MVETQLCKLRGTSDILYITLLWKNTSHIFESCQSFEILRNFLAFTYMYTPQFHLQYVYYYNT